METETRASALLDGPAGCALLLMAKQGGLTADDVARPRTSMALAVDAVDALNPWRGDDLLTRTDELRQQARSLTDLAHAVVVHPQTQWWWTDLDRDAQHEPLAPGRDGRIPSGPTTPTAPSSGWDLYAQKWRGGTWTSTVRGGTSTMAVAIARGVGDVAVPTWSGVAAVSIEPQARVYEVHQPDDWHDLCLRHPAIFDGTNLEVLAGTTVPDWHAVAGTFDAVHLSLGGLLTSLWRTTSSDAGVSTLWSWEFEGTHWLREVLTRGPVVADGFEDDRDDRWRPAGSTADPSTLGEGPHAEL